MSVGQTTDEGFNRAERRRASKRGRGRRYVSAQAYYHALRAASAEAKGDLEQAADELQLCLVYDQESLRLTLELGRVSLRLGRLSKAKKMVVRAERLAPRATAVALFGAEVALADGKPGRAERILRRASRRSQASIEVPLRLAQLLVRRDRFKEARPVLRRAADRWPQQTRPLQMLSEVELKLGKVPAAVAALRRALRRASDERATLIALTDALERQGQLSEAIKLWQPYLQRHPSDHAARLAAVRAEVLLHGPSPKTLSALMSKTWSTAQQEAVAEMLAESGAYTEAVGLLTPLTQRAGAPARLVWWLGHCHYQLAQHQRAMAALESVGADAGPWFVKARALLATLHLERGDNRRARQALQVAFERGQTHPDLVALFAQAHIARGDVQPALQVIEQSERTEGQALVWAQAQLLFQAQGYEAARDQLQQSQRWPAHQVQRALGRLGMMAGQPAQAERWLKQAQRSGPPHAQLWAERARAALADRPSAAIKYGHRGLALDPRACDLLDALARAYLAAGDLEHARTFSDRAGRLCPRAPQIMELRGDIKWQQGDHKGAKVAWRSARTAWRGRGARRGPEASSGLARISEKLARRAS